MPTFNIEKLEFKTKRGIKEEKIRNIIEDSFPVADKLQFEDVANKIRDELGNLGYNFNVFVTEFLSHALHTNCGISIVGNEIIRYFVKYNGENKCTRDDRTTTGNKYLVVIWN